MRKYSRLPWAYISHVPRNSGHFVWTGNKKTATPVFVQCAPFVHLERRSRLSLLDSQRVLEETEGIGQGVVGDLESQRESLLRSQAHVRDTGRVSDQARRLLRSIARNEFRHRLMLYLIILGLSTAIVFVLYFKLRRHFK